MKKVILIEVMKGVIFLAWGYGLLVSFAQEVATPVPYPISIEANVNEK